MLLRNVNEVSIVRKRNYLLSTQKARNSHPVAVEVLRSEDRGGVKRLEPRSGR